ncbi:MAG: zincin-like metallopeptidase domain-containing protein [Verrucomicrobiota bacterium]
MLHSWIEEGGARVEQFERERTQSQGGFHELRGHGRPDVFELVTEQILGRLSTGVVPWQSPSLARVGMPRNFHSGRAYQGINVFLLGAHQFQSPHFLTFLQAQELGGRVRRGEHGMFIVKLGTWRRDGQETQDAADQSKETASSPRRFLKVYTVFNACQIEGIEFPPPPTPPAYSPSVLADRARQIVDGMPHPPLIHEGRKAFPHYVPPLDTVEMPSRETFQAEWRYYITLFHELGHATGHASRLSRPTLIENRGIHVVGSEKKIYCQEELVAEMTAAFLGAYAGIVEDAQENSAAYLKGWMDVLRVHDHRTWLIKAAAEAQRAANYVLGTAASPTGESEPALSTPP